MKNTIEDPLHATSQGIGKTSTNKTLPIYKTLQLVDLSIAVELQTKNDVVNNALKNAYAKIDELKEQVKINHNIALTKTIKHLEQKLLAAEAAEAYKNYFKILIDEIEDLVGSAIVHGWSSKNYEAGKIARHNIEIIEEKYVKINKMSEEQQPLSAKEIFDNKFPDQIGDQTRDLVLEAMSEYANQQVAIKSEEFMKMYDGRGEIENEVRQTMQKDHAYAITEYEERLIEKDKEIERLKSNGSKLYELKA